MNSSPDMSEATIGALPVEHIPTHEVSRSEASELNNAANGRYGEVYRASDRATAVVSTLLPPEVWNEVLSDTGMLEQYAPTASAMLAADRQNIMGTQARERIAQIQSADSAPVSATLLSARSQPYLKPQPKPVETTGPALAETADLLDGRLKYAEWSGDPAPVAEPDPSKITYAFDPKEENWSMLPPQPEVTSLPAQDLREAGIGEEDSRVPEDQAYSLMIAAQQEQLEAARRATAASYEPELRDGTQDQYALGARS